jgi:hypothetical protein
MAKDMYLLFEEAAKRYFHYLEIDFDFGRPQSQRIGHASLVRFESARVYVSLRYGPPSFEVKMRFGRIGIDDKPDAYAFDQGDLQLLECCQGWKWTADGGERIETDVAWFAKMLGDCGRLCLLGDSTIYEEMKVRRDAAVVKWRHEEKLRPLQEKLARAWVSKEYVEVFDLLTRLQALGKSLTPLEQKQFEYARKHAIKREPN